MARLRTAALVALILTGLGRAGGAAPDTARDLYSAALTREQGLRSEKAPSLRDYRAAAAAYDAVVRKFPASGYVDNALWQGAALASEAFERFGDERDEATARRMLQLLATDYRFSPLSLKARETLKRMDARKAPPTPAAAQPPAAKPPPRRLATLKDVRRTTIGDRVRVTLELDAQTPYRSESVENPRRMFVDIADSRLGSALSEGTLSYDEEVIRRVRIGRHPDQTTRVVVDLDGIRHYTVSSLTDPFRIVIDCERASATPGAKESPAAAPAPSKPPAASPAAKTAASKAPLASRALPLAASPAPDVESLDVWSQLDHAPPPPRPRMAVPAPSRKPLAPAPPPGDAAGDDVPAKGAAAPVPPRGAYSLSRQLGLGASKIVIDPGHGGHDPGALGAGISEAEVVLDVALRLEALLRDAGLDVVLTRRVDEFVPLEERPAIATREQADLFLSIHANASRNRTARGIETYFLNFSNDPDAEAVAVRENAATERRMNSLPDIVRAIALNNKLDESRSFAGLVQRALAQQLAAAGGKVTDHGVKQAPFVVLIGAAMPSVLVEISFITNTQEGRLLKTPAYRQRIAQALFDGVRGYQRSLKSASPALFE